MNKDKGQQRMEIDLDKINLDGSLGLLALGDVAFEAWREVKKRHNAQEKDSKTN